MNDKDKWSAHLEYLKTAIALSTAILTASVAIFSDTAKIPTGTSVLILIGCVVFVFLMLISSIFGVIQLCNFLIRDPNNTAQNNKIPNLITISSGLSFLFFLCTAICVLAFVGYRSSHVERTSPALAIEKATALASSLVKNPGQTLVFQRLETSGDAYSIVLDVVPDKGSFQIIVSITTGEVVLASKQP